MPSNQRILDHCLLRSNWLALPDLYVRIFAEYDWRYHARDRDFYQKYIKNGATLVASMVWSRIAALTPDTVNSAIGLSPNPRCDPEGLPTLSYGTNVTVVKRSPLLSSLAGKSFRYLRYIQPFSSPRSSSASSYGYGCLLEKDLA